MFEGEFDIDSPNDVGHDNCLDIVNVYNNTKTTTWGLY